MMNKASLQYIANNRINVDPRPATFRSTNFNVALSEPFQQRMLLSAGIRDGADYEVFTTETNVANQGVPKIDEEIIIDGLTYLIIGVRMSPFNAFATLQVRKI